MKRLINTSFSHVIIVLGLALVSLLFYYPLLSGKTLIQSDIRQYEGMSRQLQEHRESTGEETYWIDNAYGGMPTYQLGARYPSDLLQPIYSFIRILPRPAHILFLYLVGGYLLLIILRFSKPVALFGALAFGFSTYLLIILQVGHNTKALAVSFFPFVISGLLLLFEKRWLWGFVTTSLALGMQIRANHYQMTYYLLMLVGVFILVYAFQAVKEKQGLNFFKSVGVFIAASIIALGLNATPLLTTAEYTNFSTRGPSELKYQADGSPKEQSSGLDYDYITEYSYGIFESLNLIAPRIQGGGSSENLGRQHGVYDFLIQNGVSRSQASEFSKNVPTYWGDQPILEAPAYVGITVFFFALFGMFFVKSSLRNALVLGILFSLLLSWGKNLSFLTDFFIQYIPFYNKFRAVSSIQVVLEFCLPVLASMGLYHLFYTKEEKDFKNILKIALIPVGILGVFFLSQGMLSFTGPNDAYFTNIYGPELVGKIREARRSIFQADIFRALIFCMLLLGVIFLFQRRKIKLSLAIGIVITLLVIDLIGVSNRYISREAFVSSRLAVTPFQITAADQVILQDSSRFRVFEPRLGLTGARTAYFHNSIGGYHGAKPRRFEELFEVYNAQQNTKILDFLNVKYILYPDEKDSSLQPLLNPNALGPVWFVNELKVMPSADSLLEEIEQTDFSSEALILENTVPKNLRLSYSKDSLAKIQLVNAKPDRLTYDVSASSPQFAVFSEMYYPDGWSARVNGKLTPIHNVNYVLRGLEIPANTSEIEFYFEPEVVVQGTRIRWGSFFFFIVGVLGIGYFQYFKTRPQ